MADWKVQAQEANTLNTSTTAAERTSARGGKRAAAINDTFDPGSYDVVGINASKAKAAGDAMARATGGVMGKLDSIKMDQTKLDSAVKGKEVQDALAQYLEKVKDYCEAVVSDIKAFSDKLYEVSKVWEESQKKFASESISSDTQASFGDNTTTAYHTTQASEGTTVPGELG